MNWFSDHLPEISRIASMNNGLLVSILASILAYPVTAFAHRLITRPRLVSTISGGGNGPLDDGENFCWHYLTLKNSPSFLGCSVNRKTLVVQSAIIHDPEGKSGCGQMRWLNAPETKPFKTDIKCGQEAALYIYGIYKNRVHYYSGNAIHNIEHSNTMVEIGESRKLEIHIVDTLGRKYIIPFKITANEAMSHSSKIEVSIRLKINFSDRINHFISGFRFIFYGLRSIFTAFTRPEY